VTASDLRIPARGPDLGLTHTWDSQRAQSGAVTAAGQGWSDNLTASMGGVLTQTVVFTDAAGTQWDFPYYGPTSGNGPYMAYDSPPGQPWQLSTSPITGYSLTNFLTGEVMAFDAQGRYVSATDAYGNQNALTPGTNTPTGETNSGGRSLAFGYTNGLLTDARSPLWQSLGGRAAGSQHVTYSYVNGNQLSTVTTGAGTSDATTATFGYQGQQLSTVTTGAGHAWTLGYDGFGRVTSVTSPASGTVGQAGYTPSYTTALSYSPGQTEVVEGAGSTAPLTHTYTLDAQGQATQTQDGRGDTSSTTYDTDHDPLTTTDANGNTTTYAYQYAGPTGSIGLLTQTVRPAISLYVPGNTPTTSVITNRYDPTTYDLLETDKPEGGVTLYAYDAYHSPITTTMLASDQGNGFCPNAVVRSPGAPAVQPLGTCSYVQQWRASINRYDSYGERTSTVDGRGFVPSSLRTTSADGSVVPPTPQLDPVQAPLYTRTDSYTPQGDLHSESTPPITTTLNGITTSGPVTTTYGYDGDGNQTGVTSANGNTTTTAFDHLGRQVSTTQPPVALWSSTAVAAVNSGGGAAGRFADDAYYTGGSTYAVGQAVDTSGAPNPAPQAVYQSERYGNFSYIVPNLTPGAPYRVRLHFAEIAFGNGAGGGAGSRIFNVSINGAQMLSNFDVYQTAGGPLKAIVEEFAATADAGGQITITYTSVKDNAKSSGVEIIPATTPTDRTSYDADGNAVRTSNANGETTTSSYDPWQRLVSTTNPVSGTTLYTYTATEQTATRDPQGNVTTSQYDPAGRLTLTTDPSHNTTQEQYDAVGNTVALTGGTALAATSVETRTYDARNEVATDTTSGPGLTTPLTTQTAYDGDGNVAQVEQPNGDTVYHLYDLTDLTLSTQTDPKPVGKSQAQQAPKYETYAYDAAGNQVSHTDADNRTETTTLDADNRTVQDVATVPGPSGTTTITTTNTFDPDGNAVSWTRQTQPPTGPVQTQTDSATFDAADRLTSSTDNGLTTRYGYDAAGQQRTHTIADGTTTVTTSLDPEGRQTGLSEGLGGSGPYASHMGYNANDLPITMTLPGGSGVAEGMGYDPSSRLVTQTLAGPAVVTLGNTHSGSYQDTGDANDMQGSQISTGPQGGQLTSISAYVGAIDPTPANDQYQVALYADSGGAPGALVASSASATLVANNWNSVALAATLAPNTSYWLMYNTNASTASYNNLAYDAGGVGSYSPAAQPFGSWPSTFGTSTSLAYGYSLYATLASGAPNPALTLSSSYAYGYNPLNWTTRTTTLSGTDTLVHDARGRLTSESGQQVVATGGSYRWTYDANGNLLSQIGDDGYPVTYTYTQAITPNQLQTMVMGDGQPTASYGYDVHGDTTAITDGNLLNTHLSYDSQARPTQITTLDHRTPLTVTLSYNPSGQRASYHVVEPGQPTLDQQFTYRSGMLGQVRLTSGTTAYTDTYLYTAAGTPYELLRTSASGSTSRYWYEVDGRGNVVALTDINGKVVDRYAYDSWGELTSNDATDETVPQQLRYAGYWYDEKLSWYWLSVRYYDPEIERFLQPDPSERDGVRTYAYVADDPIDATDPSGLASPTPSPTPSPTQTKVAGTPVPCSAYKNHTVCESTATPTPSMTPVQFFSAIFDNPDTQQLVLMILTDGALGVGIGGMGDEPPVNDAPPANSSDPQSSSTGSSNSVLLLPPAPERVLIGPPAPPAAPEPAWITFDSLPVQERQEVQSTLGQISGVRPGPRPGSVKAVRWATEFNNRPLRGQTVPELPAKPAGYYHEYRVVPVNATRAGALRIVTGSNGEVYYTWTHYGGSGQPSFVRLK